MTYPEMRKPVRGLPSEEGGAGGNPSGSSRIGTLWCRYCGELASVLLNFETMTCGNCVQKEFGISFTGLTGTLTHTAYQFGRLTTTTVKMTDITIT